MVRMLVYISAKGAYVVTHEAGGEYACQACVSHNFYSKHRFLIFLTYLFYIDKPKKAALEKPKEKWDLQLNVKDPAILRDQATNLVRKLR